MSPRKLFDQELSELHQDILQMAEWIEEGYQSLFDALEQKDGDMIKRYVRHDRVIGDMQRNIESRCLTLLARQTPVARDLRTVSAALKVVTDLERIGNHLSDMAELFGRMGLVPLTGFSAEFPAMINATDQMVREAVDAFVKRDISGAEQVIQADDEVDLSFNKVKNDIVTVLRVGETDADTFVDALMAAKYLEKIADHAVNIGKWEIFQETGIMDEVRLL